ncbi:MAG: hypothetical protein R3F59_31430 [Myxococcota bacterium]
MWKTEMCGVVLLVLGLACGAPTAPPEVPPAPAPEAAKPAKAGRHGDLGALKGQHVDGCGCGLQKNGETWFQVDIEENGWLNVAGEDVAVHPAAGASRRPSALGESTTETWSGDGVQAEVTWTQIPGCEGEECESVSYDVKITSDDGAVKLTGACGC